MPSDDDDGSSIVDLTSHARWRPAEAGEEEGSVCACPHCGGTC
eukprot:gene410-4129_t